MLLTALAIAAFAFSAPAFAETLTDLYDESYSSFITGLTLFEATAGTRAVPTTTTAGIYDPANIGYDEYKVGRTTYAIDPVSPIYDPTAFDVSTDKFVTVTNGYTLEDAITGGFYTELNLRDPNYTITFGIMSADSSESGKVKDNYTNIGVAAYIWNSESDTLTEIKQVKLTNAQNISDPALGSFLVTDLGKNDTVRFYFYHNSNGTTGSGYSHATFSAVGKVRTTINNEQVGEPANLSQLFGSGE